MNVGEGWSLSKTIVGGGFPDNGTLKIPKHVETGNEG
jgi:hypothetical protein